MKITLHKTNSHESWEGHERGQILVLVAIMMVGLLVATGLAVDGGFLFLRKAQLDRALDSAALTGVPHLVEPGEGLDWANVRGAQLLASNGIVIPDARSGPCVSGALPASLDYCGEQLPGNLPGSVRYHVIARWNVPLFFMPLVKINHVPLTADSTTEYYSMVDVYASDVAEYGLVKSATLALFGPEICYDFGDPYTADDSPYYSELNGVYTYRIAIPSTYAYPTVRVEIFDPSTANLSTTNKYWNSGNDYTIWNSQSGAVTTGAACSGNDRRNPCLIKVTGDVNNQWWFVRTEEMRGTGTWGECGQPSGYDANRNTDTLFRLYYYEKTSSGQFQEVDLAYYKSGRDTGTPATNLKFNESIATDNMWVSPGNTERDPAFNDIFCLTGHPSCPMGTPLNSPIEPATTTEVCNDMRNSTVTIHSRPATPVSNALKCSTPNNGDGKGDFIINLSEISSTRHNEVPNIYVDPNTGTRYLYIQVHGLNGSTENGYQLWAGPAIADEPKTQVPSDINARHVYIQRKRIQGETDWHLSHGIGVTGTGHLPMNHNADNRVELPLAYIGPEYAGQDITIQLFDADVGPYDPIYFFFDTIAKTDWIACYSTAGVGNCTTTGGTPPGPGAPSWTFRGDDQIQNGLSSQWATYTFTLPNDLDPTHPVPFYGGRLMVSYGASQDDTFGWKITIDSRPVLVG